MKVNGKPLADKREKGFGYNEYALKSLLALAGFDITGKALGEIIGLDQVSANYRFKTGRFTRQDIALIAHATKASPEQMQKAFFTGEKGKFIKHKGVEYDD